MFVVVGTGFVDTRPTIFYSCFVVLVIENVKLLGTHIFPDK